MLQFAVQFSHLSKWAVSHLQVTAERVDNTKHKSLDTARKGTDYAAVGQKSLLTAWSDSYAELLMV